MLKYAKVTRLDEHNKFYVTFFGEINESKIYYPTLSTYTPKIGDVVVFIKDDLSKYLCLGTINTGQKQ